VDVTVLQLLSPQVDAAEPLSVTLFTRTVSGLDGRRVRRKHERF